MKRWIGAWLASGCLAVAGDSPEALCAAARSHLRAGRFEEARAACREIIGATNAPPKTMADAWLLTAQSFFRESRVSRRLDDRAEAIAAFERAAAQEGLTPAERLAVTLPAAESLLALGEPARARALAVAQIVSPTNPRVAGDDAERLQIVVGASYYQETNYPAAKSVFTQLLDTTPGPRGEKAAYRHLGMIRGAEEGVMEKRLYPSSLDTNLVLSAEFHLPPEPKPLCLFFHGWHMTAEASRKALEIGPLLGGFFLVNVDMRGRKKSGGAPDASGFELIDGLDALDYARRTWPERIDAQGGVFVVGGSGGGGNTLALAGKAPDLFSAAVSWAGLSDYASMYERDVGRRVRDEMEVWIGGTPESNPEGYASRGGLHGVENMLTALLVLHATNDIVPLPDAMRARADALGKTNLVFKYNDLAHDSIEWKPALAHLKAHASRPTLAPKGRLAVNSFVACRAFWLVLDHPSRMGWAEYELDGDGRLAALAFSQEPGRTPVESARLRVFGPAVSVQVPGAAGPAVERIAGPAGCTDFRVTGRAPWRVTVSRETAGDRGGR